MTEHSEEINSTVLFGAVDVLGEACEKLLTHMGYDTWTDEHLETALERAFAPEILEEIRLVQLAREALRMTNHLRINSAERPRSDMFDMNYLDATRVEGAPESRPAVEHCSESPGSARRLEAFAFDIGDKVTITEVDRPGRVEALMIDFLGPQYRVAYWDNGERKTVWLQADELNPQ